MNIPVLVLLGFAAWTLIILSVGVGGYRWALILSGRASVAGWRADAPQGADWYQRVTRAHMNCVENLPVYGAIVVALTVVGLQTPLVDGLSEAMLAARIGQTLVHVDAAPDQCRRERPLHPVFHPIDLHDRDGRRRRGGNDSLKRSRPRRRLLADALADREDEAGWVFEEETPASPLAANGLYARLQFGAAALTAMAEAAQSGRLFRKYHMRRPAASPSPFGEGPGTRVLSRGGLSRAAPQRLT